LERNSTPTKLNHMIKSNFSLGILGAILSGTVNLLDFRGSPTKTTFSNRHTKTKVISDNGQKVDAMESSETIEVGEEAELPTRDYVLTNYGEVVPRGFENNTIPYFPTLINTRYAEKIWNHQKRKNRLIRIRESKGKGSKRCRYSVSQKGKESIPKTFKNSKRNRPTQRKKIWRGFCFTKGTPYTKLYS